MFKVEVLRNGISNILSQRPSQLFAFIQKMLSVVSFHLGLNAFIQIFYKFYDASCFNLGGLNEPPKLPRYTLGSLH